MLAEIFAAVLMFTGTVVLLVLAILAARSRLVVSGDIAIDVDEHPDKRIQTRAGGKLLDTLAAEGIFLSSACGGSGTCGQCKCQVLEGGGEALPTEAEKLSRGEIREGWRLACQMPVKQSLRIRLPEGCLDADQLVCEVVSNDNVATFIKELTLKLPEGVDVDFRAGGYMQLVAPRFHQRFRDFDIPDEYRGDWDRFGLLDIELDNQAEETVRAYSMANYPEEKGLLKFNIRIATPPPKTKGIPPGIVSTYVFGLKPGDKVTVFGPFGEFYARDTDNEMVYIGGGAGMAPLRSHIFDLLKRLKSGRKISFWYGARSLREAFYVEEFDALAAQFPNFTWHLVLSEPQPEDDWRGKTGFIHQAVYDHYLKAHPAPEDCEYYLCGPPMMLSSTRKMLGDLGVEPEHILFDDFGS